MAEFTLTAEPFLGRYEQSFASVKLREIYDIALVSAAVPLGKLAAANTRCNSCNTVCNS